MSDEQQIPPSKPVGALLVRSDQLDFAAGYGALEPESLCDPVVRRRLAEVYLRARDADPNSSRVAIGVGAACFALATVASSISWIGLMLVIAGIFATSVGLVTMLKRHRTKRRASKLSLSDVRAHLDRAVFNAGEKWNGLSREERLERLERDLRLLADSPPPASDT